MTYLRRRRRHRDGSSAAPSRIKGPVAATSEHGTAAAVITGNPTIERSDPGLTASANLIALQRTIGNRRVARVLDDARAQAGPTGGRSRRAPAPTAVALAPAVQRNGPYEFDFGKSPPTSPSTRKLDQDHRLRAIDGWLKRNRTKLAWLGLFDQDRSENGPLAEGVEWATAHMSMWLAVDETLSDEVWADINKVYQLATVWLREHEGPRFKDIDATLGQARDLGIDWAARAIAGKKQEVEDALASNSPLYWKTVNAAMRTLDRWAASWPPLLGGIKAAMDEYEAIRLDYVEVLDQVQEAIDAHEKLHRRNAHRQTLDLLRPQVDAIVKKTRLLTAAPRDALDAAALKRIEAGFLAAVGQLKKYKKPIYELGGDVEEAVGRLPSGRGGVRGQRTSLPTVTATIVARDGIPICEMLIQAVKEAKTPEWKQAAVDFILGNLALGRPDHIHICGGGNTLIYRGRLIRGFMAEHLDSRQVSQALFTRIKYRDTNNPVRVAAYKGLMHEVVAG